LPTYTVRATSSAFWALIEVGAPGVGKAGVGVEVGEATAGARAAKGIAIKYQTIVVISLIGLDTVLSN
jgi:hypothetical protein